MALIKCPECKKEISDSADSCPHCGYKFKNNNDGNTTVVLGKDDSNTLLVVGIILLFVFPILGFIFIVIALSKKKKERKAKERSDMEKILIKNAKIDALASIDPSNTEKTKEQLDIVKKLDDLD